MVVFTCRIPAALRGNNQFHVVNYRRYLSLEISSWRKTDLQNSVSDRCMPHGGGCRSFVLRYPYLSPIYYYQRRGCAFSCAGTGTIISAHHQLQARISLVPLLLPRSGAGPQPSSDTGTTSIFLAADHFQDSLTSMGLGLLTSMQIRPIAFEAIAD